MPFDASRQRGAGESTNQDLNVQERLEYVADLLAELQTIVAPAASQTLTGLLELSEAEARRVAQQKARL